MACAGLNVSVRSLLKGLDKVVFEDEAEETPVPDFTPEDDELEPEDDDLATIGAEDSDGFFDVDAVEAPEAAETTLSDEEQADLIASLTEDDPEDLEPGD